MNETSLPPCPICGEPATVTHYEVFEGYVNGLTIRCEDCGITTRLYLYGVPGVVWNGEDLSRTRDIAEALAAEAWRKFHAAPRRKRRSHAMAGDRLPLTRDAARV